ncbi:hypothetical protein EW145_g5638 [Phellinidium pouzarii]|uniref:Tyrosine--tRNA ligase n=1 Tax=Phellinidium pouzarii TaxID=167371 RepID=A0A4S4KZA7_9AGAM|nr:hypothetical protein EW145_g5638 [Phellinidium pouzarii]
MSTNATPEERFELMTRRLQEVLGENIIKTILAEGRHPKCYWGTAPTGRHFLRAGVEVTILLADIHAFLDNLKAPLELVAHRTKYYQYVLLTVFRSLGVPTSKLRFVEGSSYQLSREYNMDNYRLAALVTENDAKRAGSEVVKQVSSPLLSGLLYPGLQALDEQYLGCDFQFGGIDQRKIFIFAELFLPQLGYSKRAHLMNAMVPGLAGGKMSSSDPNSKIDFLDPPATIKKKIKAAFCEPGNVTENGLLAFVKAVLIPISQLRLERLAGGDLVLEPGLGDQRPFIDDDAPNGTVFSISRPEKHGGPVHYTTYDDLETDFKEEKVHPGDLKGAVSDSITRLLAPIQELYAQDTEWQEITALAYPDPNAKKDVKKKEKKKHGRMPLPPGASTNGSTNLQLDAVSGDKLDLSQPETTEENVSGETPREQA